MRMTAKQAAEYLQISRSSLYKYRSLGLIIYHQPAPNIRVSYYKEDLDRFKTRHKKNHPQISIETKIQINETKIQKFLDKLEL